MTESGHQDDPFGLSKVSTENRMNPAFAFSQKHLNEIKELKNHYPEGRTQSLLIPVLWMAQRHNQGWLSYNALEEVGRQLDLPVLRVHEVASFYTMFHLSPVGKNCIQVCRTTSCCLKGSDNLMERLKQRLKIKEKEVSQDALFSFEEVECLGACANAPVVQINDDYFEDLTPEALDRIIDLLSRGESPKTGSQTGRSGSKPWASDPRRTKKSSEGSEGC